MRAALALALLMSGGCGTLGESAANYMPTLVEVAKTAAPYLLEMARKSGVEVRKDLTACYPVSEVVEAAADVELPALVLMCVAPKVSFSEAIE